MMAGNRYGIPNNSGIPITLPECEGVRTYILSALAHPRDKDCVSFAK